MTELAEIIEFVKIEISPECDTKPSVSYNDRSSDVVGRCVFLELPYELHSHIVSFLSKQLFYSSLLSLLLLCRQTKSVYEHALYVDPFAFMEISPREDHFMYRSARLGRVLKSRPDLCAMIRHFRTVCPLLDFWDVRKDKALKHTLPSALSQDLRELYLYLSDRVLDDRPESVADFRHGLYEIARLFPNLRSLKLIPFYHCHPSRGKPPVAANGVDYRPFTSFPALSHLNVSFVGKISQPSVYRNMISTVAPRIVSLILKTKSIIGDVETFPVCPKVRELSILEPTEASTNLGSLLRRCFPCLISLCVSPRYSKKMNVDLSGLPPSLEHVLLPLSWYPTNVPQSIKTLSISERVGLRGDRPLLTSPLFKTVQAICLMDAWDWKEVFAIPGPDGTRIGSSILLSLEIRGTGIQKWRISDLVRYLLVSQISLLIVFHSTNSGKSSPPRSQGLKF